eukprot:UC4_evm1s293
MLGSDMPCKLSPFSPFRIDHVPNSSLGGGTLSLRPNPYLGAPNIVFLVVESTDGRTWTPGYQNGVFDHGGLQNLRRLQENGTEFRLHYSNAPVCCPSRATFWSGRHAHNIPHNHGSILVDGVFNNYEGLPANYTDRIDQILYRRGYNTGIFGKEDWTTGGHGESLEYTDLALWMMYSYMPYSIPDDGGWQVEAGCKTNGTVLEGGSNRINGSAHRGDWSTLEEAVAWTKSAANEYLSYKRPFFVYQGFNIVHPPYATNKYWLEKIDPIKVNVPEWPEPTAADLEKQHPCCIPALKNGTDVAHQYSKIRRRRIRQIYLAMISEFDAMLGLWMEEIKDMGIWDNTVWIVTSDHGDMQLEHQQFYKMTPYDASSRVPMVFYDPRNPTKKTYNDPSQLIDIMPTILDLANIEKRYWPIGLDGSSLLPRIAQNLETSVDNDDFVVSQFHGKNIAMSWFLIVMRSNGSAFKLIVYGTGNEVPSQLFDLQSDPEESVNLISDPKYQGVADSLKERLQEVVDFPRVAQVVAEFNQEIFKWWIQVHPDWKNIIASQSNAAQAWNRNATASFEALEKWLAAPAVVKACRGTIQSP